jgi:hypothetical protein
MTVTRTKKIFLIIAASLATGMLSDSSFIADVSEKGTGSQKSDPKPTSSG